MGVNYKFKIIGSCKTHWPFFILIWFFPILFLFGGKAAENFGYGIYFTKYFAFPLFFFSFIISIIPFFLKKLSLKDYWLLGQVMPFIIWVISVFSRLGYMRFFS